MTLLDILILAVVFMLTIGSNGLKGLLLFTVIGIPVIIVVLGIMMLWHYCWNK